MFLRQLTQQYAADDDDGRDNDDHDNDTTPQADVYPGLHHTAAPKPGGGGTNHGGRGGLGRPHWNQMHVNMCEL